MNHTGNVTGEIESAQTLASSRQTLKDRYAELEAQIIAESQRQLPDFVKVQTLTRSRQRIAEEMTMIEGVLRTIDSSFSPDVA